ncbi:proteasome inhibitor PI31 subunit isoform X1 [Canis lupus familiaris]|uniref:proteasome inhibitor PI31 subunit isoform X1 n=1 Tax=Canis lupus familiaris TaxID=9615 RepID=UPI0018F7D64E|nr:proteasome inhibitor PI31 subunit isoform X1 [Canis lupus familiaris]
MAGLEVLFASVAPAITSAQDALVCFLHWEVVTHGYYSVGTGDQPGPNDKKSELLPAEWNSNKDLYVLRYESKDGSRKLLVKAVTVENSMIINVLEFGSQQVSDLTLNLDDYIDSEHLGDFHRTYKNSEELRSRIASGIITPIHEHWDKASVSSLHREFPPATAREVDPLRIHPQHPHTSRQPPWVSKRWHDRGSPEIWLRGQVATCIEPIILGPPKRTLPQRRLCPPGARFDPFGPIGTSPSGPNPDHLPPPGYDDMYL